MNTRSENTGGFVSEVLNNIIEIGCQVVDSQVIEIDCHVKRKSKPVALNLAMFLNQPERSLETNAYLQRQAQCESNARSYPRRLPLALKRGQGVYVEDTQGQVFIDCLAAAGTLALGHSHPEVTDALMQTLESGVPLQTLDLTTPIKDQFIEQLFALLPGNMADHARIQMCSPCGSDAVEAALKLAKIATGRRSILAFSGAYHGMTQGALALMGNLGAKSAISMTGADVQIMPFPYAPRCPYGLGESGIKASLYQLETMLTDPESGVAKPAAIIVEAVQGEAGSLPADPTWLKGLRDITKRHGIVFIIDEIQAGMGRTGKVFAFEHAEIEPDVIVVSKALGGGQPLAAVIYHSDFDQWTQGAHAGTFRGNQLAMASGMVVLRHLAEEQLHLHAGAMGCQLKQALQNINSTLIGDVRGRGLMLGVEIVDPAGALDSLGNLPQDGKRALAIQQAALKRGLIIEVGGRFGSTIRFLPPLIVTEQEIEVIAAIFAAAVHSVAD
jgi:diaminobutyrate-2-oxoglutarate transaminase